MLRPINKIPDDAAKEKRAAGRIVLAWGEATGHAHVIEKRNATSYVLKDRRFLGVVDVPVLLKHEEHAPIEVPVGDYEIVRQVTYTPEEIRSVAD